MSDTRHHLKAFPQISLINPHNHQTRKEVTWSSQPAQDLSAGEGLRRDSRRVTQASKHRILCLSRLEVLVYVKGKVRTLGQSNRIFCQMNFQAKLQSI